MVLDGLDGFGWFLGGFGCFCCPVLDGFCGFLDGFCRVLDGYRVWDGFYEGPGYFCSPYTKPGIFKVICSSCKKQKTSKGLATCNIYSILLLSPSENSFFEKPHVSSISFGRFV